MGLTFKENVRDIRNSKSFEVIKFLETKGFVVHAYDKYVDYKSAKKLKINLVKNKFKFLRWSNYFSTTRLF